MIKVSVPATSANMGPGFDCMGIALNIYNTFTIEETNQGLYISGCPEELCNKNNLIYKSMLECFKVIGYQPKGYNIAIETNVPLSRGLGSSATCIVGGVLAANEIAGGPLNKEKLLQIATKIEGHPDNIAPALLGGMVLSIIEEENILYNKVQLFNGLKFCALIPNFPLSTHQSRKVLPKKVSYQDAVYNVAHSSLFVSALINGNYAILPYACQDQLHQPYRGKLIANYQDIVDQCKKLNSLCSFLSGAGPTIMAILPQEEDAFIPSIKEYLATLPHDWKALELQIDAIGAIVEKK